MFSLIRPFANRLFGGPPGRRAWQQFLRVRFADWRLSRLGHVRSRQATSYSDLPGFQRLLLGAVSDERVFSIFRSHPQFNAILDHVSVQQAEKYISVLDSRDDNWHSALTRLQDFSVVGSPRVAFFPRFGWVAPTLFRYLKVASDLRVLFPQIGKMEISEIGIGWGGQAWILRQLFSPPRFNLYDLPEMLALSAHAMDKFPGADSNFFYFDGTVPLKGRSSDLLISNYAFSEISRQHQSEYMDKVILRSKCGYITWNPLSKDGYSVRELLEVIPGSRVIEEYPLTGEKNCVIVWGSAERLDPVNSAL